MRLLLIPLRVRLFYRQWSIFDFEDEAALRPEVYI